MAPTIIVPPPQPIAAQQLTKEQQCHMQEVDAEQAMLSMSPKTSSDNNRSPKAGRPRRMSAVEHNVSDVLATCSAIDEKCTRQRRKSVEIQKEAAAISQRLDSLLQLGTATKVVTAAAKFKGLVKSKASFLTTSVDDSDQQYTPSFDFSGKNHPGDVMCFVCDTQLCLADLNMSLCPLCNCVLNHKTIKAKLGTATKVVTAAAKFKGLVKSNLPN